MLIPEQIQFLDNFFLEKGVIYYDFRLELVDHFASLIEKELENEDNLDFTAAFNFVLGGFRHGGFDILIEEREMEMAVATRRNYVKLLLSWFTLPKVFFSLILFAFLVVPFFMFKTTSTEYIFRLHNFFFICLLIPVTIIWRIKYTNAYRQLISLKNRNLSLFIPALWVLPYFYLNILKKGLGVYITNSYIEIFVFCFLLLVFLLLNAANFEAYKKSYLKAKQDYPLAFKN